MERPLVPMEKTSATQPFPTKPLPFDRQGVTENDLIDFTPAIKADALRIASQFKMGPLFTPPIVANTGGKQFIVVAVGARNTAAELIALTLP